MKIEEYSKYTIIMRGYTLEQAMAVVEVAVNYSNYFAVEVTLNTPDALNIITELNKNYGDRIKIGAGTVRQIEDARQAIAHGAKFLLGPHIFTKELIEYCKEHKILTIPAAMTPSEINLMFSLGADIVKIFPAATVQPHFFKDVQGPLGNLRLMAVGGVSLENAQSFIDSGAQYLGLGSSLFSKESIERLDKVAYKKALDELIDLIIDRED